MASPQLGPLGYAQVRSAVAASSLGDLPAELLPALLIGARRVSIPAGQTIHHEGEATPHIELVIAGLIRVRVSAPDGRSLTVRYCRAGALIGVATLYASASRPFAIQALAPSEQLQLQPDVVRQLADEDVRVARALLLETSARVLAFVGELSESAFADVRGRIGRHLLDLASERQQGVELIADISQQQLADAVGSVREVVVRVLRDLRREEIVETGRHGIRILDPERLVTSTGGR